MTVINASTKAFAARLKQPAYTFSPQVAEGESNDTLALAGEYPCLYLWLTFDDLDSEPVLGVTAFPNPRQPA